MHTLSSNPIFLSSQQSKKKRRGIFKDFVTDILKQHGMTESGDLDKKGSMFIQAIPKVLDIQSRTLR